MTFPTPGQRSNRYDLSGRVAVVTGGGGGLGQAVSTAFARSGATVVVVERDQHRPQVDPPTGQVGGGSGQLSFVAADVLDEASVEAMVAEVLARYGRLEVLVNLVGGFAAGQTLTEMDLAVWQHMLDLNLRSTLLVSKYAARPMIQQGWGRIVNVSSRAARTGRKGAAAYAVAKSGIITLTETQDEELRSQGITANCILPSIIDTPANRASMPNAAFARWPKPEEIARVLLFLASDDAELISGAAIPVYGLA